MWLTSLQGNFIPSDLVAVTKKKICQKRNAVVNFMQGTKHADTTRALVREAALKELIDDKQRWNEVLKVLKELNVCTNMAAAELLNMMLVDIGTSIATVSQPETKKIPAEQTSLVKLKNKVFNSTRYLMQGLFDERVEDGQESEDKKLQPIVRYQYLTRPSLP